MKIKQLIFLFLLGISISISADEYTDEVAIIEAAYGPTESIVIGTMDQNTLELITAANEEYKKNQGVSQLDI